VISTDKLVREMASAMGYASQTLRLHPESKPQIEKYLRSESNRFTQVILELEENVDILERVVVY
jgi:hypothetical protein